VFSTFFSFFPSTKKLSGGLIDHLRYIILTGKLICDMKIIGVPYQLKRNFNVNIDKEKYLIPYRKKIFRLKVTNFSRDDENYSRRIILSDE